MGLLIIYWIVIKPIKYLAEKGNSLMTKSRKIVIMFTKIILRDKSPTHMTRLEDNLTSVNPLITAKSWVTSVRVIVIIR